MKSKKTEGPFIPMEKEYVQSLEELKGPPHCQKCGSVAPSPKCSLCKPVKRGRRPGPRRCVVQLRVREAGKVTSYFSLTIHVEPHEAMKRLQQIFHGDRIY